MKTSLYFYGLLMCASIAPAITLAAPEQSRTISRDQSRVDKTQGESAARERGKLSEPMSIKLEELRLKEWRDFNIRQWQWTREPCDNFYGIGGCGGGKAPGGGESGAARNLAIPKNTVAPLPPSPCKKTDSACINKIPPNPMRGN